MRPSSGLSGVKYLTQTPSNENNPRSSPDGAPEAQSPQNSPWEEKLLQEEVRGQEATILQTLKRTIRSGSLSSSYAGQLGLSLLVPWYWGGNGLKKRASLASIISLLTSHVGFPSSSVPSPHQSALPQPSTTILTPMRPLGKWASEILLKPHIPSTVVFMPPLFLRREVLGTFPGTQCFWGVTSDSVRGCSKKCPWNHVMLGIQPGSGSARYKVKLNSYFSKPSSFFLWG